MRDGGKSSAAKWNWGRARASARKSVLPGARRVFPAHLTICCSLVGLRSGAGSSPQLRPPPPGTLYWGGGSLMLMVLAQILQGCRGFIQPWGEQTAFLQPKKPFPARLREGTTARLWAPQSTHLAMSSPKPHSGRDVSRQ